MKNEIVRYYMFEDDLGDGPTYRFYIYEDGLSLPVFHIVPHHLYADITIGLFEPLYFHYNNSKADTFYYPDTLDKVLRAPFGKNTEKTNWEALRDLWMTVSGESKKGQKYLKSHNIDLGIQPDYSKMTDKDIKRRTLCQAIVSKWKA